MIIITFLLLLDRKLTMETRRHLGRRQQPVFLQQEETAAKIRPRVLVAGKGGANGKQVRRHVKSYAI